MVKTKFKKGNVVKIKKDNSFGFRSNRYAIVFKSHLLLYDKNNSGLYELIFEDGLIISWFKEEILTLVEEDGNYILKKILKAKNKAFFNKYLK